MSARGGQQPRPSDRHLVETAQAKSIVGLRLRRDVDDLCAIGRERGTSEASTISEWVARLLTAPAEPASPSRRPVRRGVWRRRADSKEPKEALAVEEVAVQVAAALGQQEYALIGGLAVAAHGYVRATIDVDFIVRDVDAARGHLREQGLSVEVLQGEFSCLRGTIEGVRFDILPPLVPIRWDRAIAVPLGRGLSIRVVDL